MHERPLLLFPSPEIAGRTKRKRMPPKVHYPSITRQGERLSPIFRQLQSSFNYSEIQQTLNGIEPEQVLVFETIGNIENFANAVKKIEGLEWMGEIEAEELLPDTDFYREDDETKELSGRLYLVMTNQQALGQMISLWQQYQANPSMKFETGLTKFRDVFLHLKDIRRWSTEDRLAENELLEVWREELTETPDRDVKFEIELWYRGSESKRVESEEVVSSLITQLCGKISGQCTISEIAYHSILAELPAKAAKQILQQPDVALIQCDNVMFFRPVGQMVTGRQLSEGDYSECEDYEYNLPTGMPLIGILDGMPLENHVLLADRIIVDDPDDWASEYPATDRQHGTAITSLIVHGDLNSNEPPLNRPVYVRPIMKPVSWPTFPRPESIPEDILVVDFIHQAVRRIVDAEAGDGAFAPTVKVINLSIGDSSRQFVQMISPLARLLDWLSVKYNILFIVSSGNHPQEIDTGLSNNEFDSLSNDEREKLIVEKLYEDNRNRRLLSPSENINGITVGAMHHDYSNPDDQQWFIDVFTGFLPSPISSFGSGYRRSVKPELLYSGGRVLYQKRIGTSKLKFSNRKFSPGNEVASPSSQPGEFNKTVFCCGTSNATALITRATSYCHDSLLKIFQDQAPEIDYEPFIIPLLKAMLVHGCSWNEVGDRLNNILQTTNNSNQLRNWVTKWLGYGMPDINKVLHCTSQRATLLGCGQLTNEEAHLYTLPLPPSLSAQRVLRKLTVTLAWLSPIVPTSQRYRQTQLWFDFEGGNKSREKLENKLKVKGIDVDGDATRRGTLQHEIFEGDRAVPIGTDDTLMIKVNCRKDARQSKENVPYGLIVSLEVAEGVEIPVYDEIKTKIALPVEIRPIEEM